jgi:hypothetical protein
MNTNSFYNLTTLLHVLQKNLHQINEYYLDQAETEEERIFYRNLKQETENNIKGTTNLMRNHLK